MLDKDWYRSKTIWLNIIAGVSAFLALPELQHVLGPDALRYVVLVQAGLNIFLRTITSQGITLTRKDG